MAELLDVPRHRIVPVVLRRMRNPLLTVIVTYAISILGLVLIPGETPSGEPHRMDFLHAFYVVTYTAPTIGYGEIPYEFTAAQRFWMIASIYTLVISWFYAIGTIVGLVRDPVFQRAITWNRFRRNVDHLSEPFTLVCGYGDTGSQLIGEITEAGQRAVVMDWDERQLDGLSVEGLRSFVPALCGDANATDNLLAAGLANPRCQALLAVTDHDHTNLHVAITAKLLNPGLTVIARSESEETRGNMASFGTDYIIDPYATFAGGFVIAIDNPETHRLYEWMSARRELPLASHRLPRRGRWLICGFSELGRSMYRRFTQQGIPTVIIAPNRPAELPAMQPYVAGKGTEAPTLREAGIEAEEVAGVIAATDDDTDNLSIAVTARELVPHVYLVARQNDWANRYIFHEARLDMVMESSTLLSLRMLRVLATPMLPRFLGLIRERDARWVGSLLERWKARMGEDSPAVWTLTLSWEAAPALRRGMASGYRVTVGDLLRDPRSRRYKMPAEVLMLERNGEQRLLPPATYELAAGDHLLLCGRPGTGARVGRMAVNFDVFRYVLSGEERPDGWLWRWLERRRKGRARARSRYVGH